MSHFRITLTRDRDLIDQLVDHVIVLSIEAQTAFADRYRGFSWRVDLSEPAVFWFEREPAAIFRPHFIGSTSETTRTWLWGWENINNFPHPVVEVAQRLREIGEQHCAAELTTAYQQLEPMERARQELPVRDIPEHVFVYCAQAVSGLAAPVHYRAPNGSGYSWFVLDNPSEFALPAPTALATSGAITRALQTGYVFDHRLAIEAYTQRRAGLSLERADDGTLVVVTSDGDVRVTFDAAGRIVSIAMASR